MGKTYRITEEDFRRAVVLYMEYFQLTIDDPTDEEIDYAVDVLSNVVEHVPLVTTEMLTATLENEGWDEHSVVFLLEVHMMHFGTADQQTTWFWDYFNSGMSLIDGECLSGWDQIEMDQVLRCKVIKGMTEFGAEKVIAHHQRMAERTVLNMIAREICASLTNMIEDVGGEHVLDDLVRVDTLPLSTDCDTWLLYLDVVNDKEVAEDMFNRLQYQVDEARIACFEHVKMTFSRDRVRDLRPSMRQSTFRQCASGDSGQYLNLNKPFCVPKPSMFTSWP